MDDQQAADILSALAGGRDPFSDATFPPDSPYQHPDTVRALFHALHRLQTVEIASPPAGEPRERRSKSASPRTNGNAGKPWSPEEDTRLAEGFDAGRDPDALASDHGRSRLAVEIRLAMLGRLPMPGKARYATASRPAPPTACEPAWTRYAVPV
ncbi:MAG: hypothetical protein GC151_03365 [Betaproteobacteria bacterium]|nr:hypothetical protein [Betaproteobacteria bacterium]